ncbi:amidohydrolase [Pseudonocardia acaciae]|uniref:amidohydrolase n=1 Tax=Pseudonocardia acaciae TaxID=551276 RepID=UPI00048B990E|nr:amidohydrolase [Pseudonocardia acaciae]
MTVDLIMHSGRVFDGHAVHPTATTLAVADGLVAAVGTEAEVRASVGAAREVVDLGGRMVVPGFVDAHVHAVLGGVELGQCALDECADEPAALAAVARYAGAHASRPWVLGGGWQMTAFAGGRPTLAALDGVLPDRPAFLLDSAHHTAWVNSRALAVAGIDAGTPDPADGRIERDPGGRPSGLLHEGAMKLVQAVLPPTDESELDAGLDTAQAYLHSFGITGWQDALVGRYAAFPDVYGAYVRAASDGRLTARVRGALWWPRETVADDVAATVAALAAKRDAAPAGRFAAGTVKIMQDGVAETATAAVLEPYVRCRCSGSGLSYFAPDLLNAMVTALDAAEFQVHVHAIGDRAVREALDAFAAAGPSRHRHHIAHLQLVDDADIHRFAALDVTANLQAFWACHSSHMRETCLPVLGPERTERQFPFGSLSRAGARLAMGSDWPVTTPDPFAAIHVAVNRREPGRPDAERLGTDQALDLTTALSAYTAGSSRVNHLDAAGTIRPGALADLAVLETDPFALPPADLHRVRTDLTLVGGHPVFERR